MGVSEFYNDMLLPYDGATHSYLFVHTDHGDIEIKCLRKI